MSYFLNLAYLLLLVVASPWLVYGALRKGKYRDGWAEKLLGRVPRREGNARCIWLHAVSVGEVNLLATLLSRLELEHSGCECVISTTTKTGYELAKKKYAPRTVFYCPLDFSWAVREALGRIRPDLLILAELELWPNLISAAKQSGAKIAIVNGRLGEKSFRGYRRIKRLVARSFRTLDLVAAQNQEYAARFVELGARPEVVQVTGSLKFDGANTDRETPATRRLATLAGIASEDTVFLAGSTQHPEESLALETFRQLIPAHPHLRLILVPRHPDRFNEVAALLDASGLDWQRRSQLLDNDRGRESFSASDCTSGIREGRKRLPTPSALPSTPRILLVDAIGELGAWWGTAQIAFVGGSLGRRGGQNMLEPAAYGAAVSFGPNTWNFKDIVAEVLAADAARVVSSGEELTGFVEKCLIDTAYAAQLGDRARRLVESQQGAAERTMRLLGNLLPAPVAASHCRAA